jgi:hypothetical protein
MDTLVKRNAPLPQRSNFNPMRLQASNFDNNQQIQSFGNIPNQNNYYNPSPAQLSSPSPWDKQTPPINYGQNPNQNLSTPQNQTYGQPQTNQYQYNNPYDQYGQQRSNKPGCLDDCRIF